MTKTKETILKEARSIKKTYMQNKLKDSKLQSRSGRTLQVKRNWWHIIWEKIKSSNECLNKNSLPGQIIIQICLFAFCFFWGEGSTASGIMALHSGITTDRFPIKCRGLNPGQQFKHSSFFHSNLTIQNFRTGNSLRNLQP